MTLGFEDKKVFINSRCNVKIRAFCVNCILHWAPLNLPTTTSTTQWGKAHQHYNFYYWDCTEMHRAAPYYEEEDGFSATWHFIKMKRRVVHFRVMHSSDPLSHSQADKSRR